MRPGTGARKCERGSHVEIRIGIANTGRELNFETNESSADVKQSIAAPRAGSSSRR